jgi:hypothetical protein
MGEHLEKSLINMDFFQKPWTSHETYWKYAIGIT